MDPLLMRFLERLLVVAIGGMAIYLGFRLFQMVPEQRDHAGKLALPWDISIVLNRVGPGVFFALFGVIGVAVALIRPLEFSEKSIGGQQTLTEIRYAGQAVGTDRAARADARIMLRREIDALNTMPALFRQDLPPYELDTMQRRIRDIKLALLKPVWGDPEEGFGSFDTFEQWAKNSSGATPPPGMEGALAIYNSGLRSE